MRSSGRVMQLDLLRALAIALVFGRHMPPLQHALPEALQPFCHYWTQCGWIGVDLFFVLSGFLISGLLFREYMRHGRISYLRFLARRGFKIYPSFYLMIAAVIYIQYTNYNYQQITPSRILSELFFVQNYAPGLLDHTWSLGVEEHFYLLLPLLLISMTRWHGDQRNPFRWLPWTGFGISLVLLAVRIIHAWGHPYTDRTHLTPTHLRIDSLFFGVVLSYYHHFHRDTLVAFTRRFAWLLFGLAILLLSPAVIYPLGTNFFLHTFGFTCFYLASGMLLVVCLTWKLPEHGLLSWPLRGIAFVGTHSYAIYLWHMPVKIWASLYIQRWFGIVPSLQANLLIYLVGSLAVGIGLSLLVEVPTLALRDHFFPSRSTPLGTTPKPTPAVVA